MIYLGCFCYCLLGSFLVGYYRHVSNVDTLYIINCTELILVTLFILTWPLGVFYVLGKRLSIIGTSRLYSDSKDKYEIPEN